MPFLGGADAHDLDRVQPLLVPPWKRRKVLEDAVDRNHRRGREQHTAQGEALADRGSLAIAHHDAEHRTAVRRQTEQPCARLCDRCRNTQRQAEQSGEENATHARAQADARELQHRHPRCGHERRQRQRVSRDVAVDEPEDPADTRRGEPQHPERDQARRARRVEERQNGGNEHQGARQLHRSHCRRGERSGAEQ